MAAGTLGSPRPGEPTARAAAGHAAETSPLGSRCERHPAALPRSAAGLGSPRARHDLIPTPHPPSQNTTFVFPAILRLFRRARHRFSWEPTAERFPFLGFVLFLFPPTHTHPPVTLLLFVTPPLRTSPASRALRGAALGPAVLPPRRPGTPSPPTPAAPPSSAPRSIEVSEAQGPRFIHRLLTSPCSKIKLPPSW